MSIGTATAIDRIVLTGFMGSGKTTVGRLFAARLRWDFVDLDEAITEAEHLSVQEIFSKSGEAHFRVCETRALAASLQRTGAVIALGGGALEEPGNRHLLLQSQGSVVVYLAGSFDLLYQRCQTQASAGRGESRPVLADLAVAEARYERRLAQYAAAAGVHLDTAGRSPEELAQSLTALLFSNQSRSSLGTLRRDGDSQP